MSTTPAATGPQNIAPVGAWDRLAIVALGTAGCALSYDALQQMAVAIHIRGQLTYLYPLVIDGFIAYGVRALLVLSTAPLRARAYIWTLFGTATTASLWANALHAVRLNQQTTQEGLYLGDTVVAVLSTLAPLALAGAVHLYILMTRRHPADHERTTHSADHQRAPSGKRTGRSAPSRTTTGAHQRTKSAADHTTAGRSADQGGTGGPRADGGTDRPAASGADQTASAPRTGTTADQGVADQGTADAPRVGGAADRRIAAGADQTSDELRTRNSAGHGPDAATAPERVAAQRRMVPGSEATAGREADPLDIGGLTDRGPAQDQQSPRDQAGGPGRPGTTSGADQDGHTADQPVPDWSAGPEQQQAADQITNSADQRTNPAADQTGWSADLSVTERSADPQGASPADQPDDAADQGGDEDEVPMERLIEIARDGALREGRMTRRAIRPYLRAQEIRISNERFGELQSRLYQDETLAHLPRSRKKAQ
ncbi:DUF2637 domain-containing protein [Streptomyces sp. NPDC102274]|uniref:DUF2637 domain-containing protein n=1 Tax=Streptomyces sp. NPDC102274 TaxID=3366151 RepID=UPI0038229B71